MLRRNYLMLLLGFKLLASNAQPLPGADATVHAGMGAYSLRHVDAFSSTANQAALAQMKNGLVAFFSERRFMRQELSSYRASVALPTHSGNFGFHGAYFGSADFNESGLGLAYGRRLGNKIDVGVQFNYSVIRIIGYGRSSALGFEAGTILHITDKFHTGFHISNPEGGKFERGQAEKLPSTYAMGIGYDASEQFYFGVEIIKVEDKSINANAELNYRIVPQVLAKAGISTGTASAWFGLGFWLASFRVDVFTTYHPQLGLSPGLMLQFKLKAKKQSAL